MCLFYRLPTIVSCTVLLSILCSSPCTAQSTRGLRCPTPKRQKIHAAPPKAFVDVSVGIAQPIMYRNAGVLESHFHFSARPGPYLGATGHLKYSSGLEATIGLEVLHNQQGLVMKYSDGSVNIKEAGYTGSLVLRVPVGVGYYVRPSWSVNAAAFIAYSSYWTYTNSGRQSLNGSGTISSQYMWQVPDTYNKWYSGISFTSQLKLMRRLSGKVFWSIDFAQATPNAGLISMDINGSAQRLEATLQPYLMNAGVGLTYRLGQHEE